MKGGFSRLVRDQALRRPDRIAVVFEGRRTTYAQLDADIDSTGGAFHRLGVRPGDRIAILALNSDSYLTIALATWRLGAVLVPLNHRLQIQELAYLLEHSGATLLVADPEFLEPAQAALRACPGEVATIVIGGDGSHGVPALEQLRTAANPGYPEADLSLDDLQRIMYTSGTTSRPKGVMVTHGMAAWNLLIQTIELGLTDRDRVLLSSPMYHIAALDAPGLAVLATGGTVVIARRFNAQEVLRLIQVEGVTGGIMVASMLHQLRDLRGPVADGAALRYLIFGVASERLYGEIRQMFPWARLIQAYGLTECCSGVTYMDSAHAGAKRGSVGPALPYMEVAVVDEMDNLLPPDRDGEIVVRGPKTTPGYWRDPEATGSLLRGGWLHTGDLGHLDSDGYLTVSDRLKDMIRSGGENVASLEIESVLATHPEVYEVAVVARADDHWLEVPRAFVVRTPDATVSEADLITYCGARLARFKTPREVVFLEALPRSESGKVLKRDLRQFNLSTADRLADERQA